MQSMPLATAAAQDAGCGRTALACGRCAGWPAAAGCVQTWRFWHPPLQHALRTERLHGEFLTMQRGMFLVAGKWRPCSIL